MYIVKDLGNQRANALISAVMEKERIITRLINESKEPGLTALIEMAKQVNSIVIWEIVSKVTFILNL